PIAEKSTTAERLRKIMQPNERSRILNTRAARHSVCGVGSSTASGFSRSPDMSLTATATLTADTGQPARCSEPYDAVCKVMLIGDSGVGKTSFLHQFKDAKFPGSTFITTVGVDYTGLFAPKLQVWDTAGTERYRSISNAYYRDADAILLFYDITNRQSFNSVRSWLADIKDHASPGVYVMLLGNKSDADARGRCQPPRGQKLAKEDSISCFMETSAKTGHQVELCHKIIGR
uniref:RAB37, member RAS oncogene family n=1 Tax=Macrostomum lignano TaxID=282301 RepID=A0A1I8F481_9PLAT